MICIEIASRLDHPLNIKWNFHVFKVLPLVVLLDYSLSKASCINSV